MAAVCWLPGECDTIQAFVAVILSKCCKNQANRIFEKSSYAPMHTHRPETLQLSDCHILGGFCGESITLGDV